MNVQLARDVLTSLWQVGVRDIVICAGARNAPFVACLSVENSFRVHPFFEERSAGFFALGKILSTRCPVAVITTSGTAAAELLPAAIEADYQGQPLILVTADRPRSYRGSGAPQTINQVGLYSHYVEKSWDIEKSLEKFDWSLTRPVHLNVCFDEPLIDAPVRPLLLQPTVAALSTETHGTAGLLESRHPLILVGGLPEAARAQVIETLKKWQRPVVLEAPSGLRGHPELEGWEILGGDKTLAMIKYDSVIRIGSVPTLRLWRDLEKSEVPVTHFSHLPFSGLPRERKVFALNALAETQTHFDAWTSTERDRDRSHAASDRELLNRFPLSEPPWVEWLSRVMPTDARVFVGNSLPIREWDFAAHRDGRFEIFANRGANGIDGLISTFLGLARKEKSNWCVIGDLSALYDLSGLWPNRREPLQDLNIVIINNSGGKIFKRLFHNSLFENPHDLNFKAWAEMWGWDYQCLTSQQEISPNAKRPRILEIQPSEQDTDDFWKSWEASR